jgi:Family of unknown function (DUF5808)
MKRLKKLLSFASIALAVAAISEQIKRPKEERDWHGTLAGAVPYDFRIPTLERVKQRWWNPDDKRIFTPHVFGVGWSINLCEVRRRLRAWAHEEDHDGDQPG